jgi:hypothetical protein
MYHHETACTKRFFRGRLYFMVTQNIFHGYLGSATSDAIARGLGGEQTKRSLSTDNHPAHLTKTPRSDRFGQRGGWARRGRSV